MATAFIRAHQAEFGVRAMCRVLRGHFSGVSAWLKEPLSLRAQDDARQTTLIWQAWSDSGRIYGYRKLTDDLAIRGSRSPRTGSPGWPVLQASWPRSAPSAVRDDMVGSLLWLRPTLWIGSSRSMRPTRFGASHCPPLVRGQWRATSPPSRPTRDGCIFLSSSTSSRGPRHGPRTSGGSMARGRMVRRAPSDDRPGAAGLACGRLAAQTQDQGDGRFRPGIAVHRPRVAGVPRPAQSRGQHEQTG